MKHPTSIHAMLSESRRRREASRAFSRLLLRQFLILTLGFAALAAVAALS